MYETIIITCKSLKRISAYKERKTNAKKKHFTLYWKNFLLNMEVSKGNEFHYKKSTKKRKYFYFN